MEINFEELAKQEINRLVAEKLKNKLHLQIQKELKSNQHCRIISDSVNKEITKMISATDLIDLIDRQKLQKDVTDRIANELLKRMLTSSYCECNDPYSDY